MRKVVRKIVQELYDQDNITKWSPEDIKSAVDKNVFSSYFNDPKSLDALEKSQKEVPSHVVDKLKSLFESQCPHLKKMDFSNEQRKGYPYQEIVFSIHKDNKSEEHASQEFGVNISIKIFKEENPKIGRKNGSITYGTYFFIENVVDKTKDPNRLIDPNYDEFNPEDPFDSVEDFVYEDEEFLEELNANEIPAKSDDLKDFMSKHLPIICKKLKRFADYSKGKYNVEVF